MKAVTIRQPWAWLIVSGHKDIENRGWAPTYRGPLLIHAGKSIDREAMAQLDAWAQEDGFKLPKPSELHLGGVIGIVDLVQVVTKSRSPWFGGPKGWVLKKPRKLPFIPWRGQQMLFDIPIEKRLTAAE